MNKRFLQQLGSPVLGAVVAGLVAWFTGSTVKLSLIIALGIASVLYLVGYIESRSDEKMQRMQVFTLFSGFVMTLLTAIAIWNVM